MTGTTQTPIPEKHPLKIAWEEYKKTDDYANTRRWAAKDEHVDGSLWAAFEQGWARLLLHQRQNEDINVGQPYVLRIDPDDQILDCRAWEAETGDENTQ